MRRLVLHRSGDDPRRLRALRGGCRGRRRARPRRGHHAAWRGGARLRPGRPRGLRRPVIRRARAGPGARAPRPLRGERHPRRPRRHLRQPRGGRYVPRARRRRARTRLHPGRPRRHRRAPLPHGRRRPGPPRRGGPRRGRSPRATRPRMSARRGMVLADEARRSRRRRGEQA